MGKIDLCSNGHRPLLWMLGVLLLFSGQGLGAEEFCGGGQPPTQQRAAFLGDQFDLALTCCTDTACGCGSKICGGDRVAISDAGKLAAPPTERLLVPALLVGTRDSRPQVYFPKQLVPVLGPDEPPDHPPPE